MSAKRKVCLITGSRAEWGLLSHVARALKARGDIALSVVATGSHLESRFGSTEQEIIADGFEISKRVPMRLEGDSAKAAVQAMARVMSGMADALSELAPDIVVLLGDRYEILAAATAGSVLGFPVAHLHGGEITEGAIDDSLRHAITKLAHLHLAATPTYRDRIIQLGEEPERVLTVGALGVDAVAQVDRLSRSEIQERLGLQLESPLLLVTYHPTTIDGAQGGAGIEPLIEALDRIERATIVFTGVNADPAHSVIAERIRQVAAAHPDRVVVRTSLGQQLYLSVMSIADAVVGNSSSGVIEAPILRVPTVNIGNRQAGRLMPSSVICCDVNTNAIEAAIRRAIAPEFRQQACHGADFGVPGVGVRIAKALAETPLAGLTRKRFYDLPRH